MYHDQAPFLDGNLWLREIKRLPEVTQLLSGRGSHRQAGARGQSYLGGQGEQNKLPRQGGAGLESI